MVNGDWWILGRFVEEGDRSLTNTGGSGRTPRLDTGGRHCLVRFSQRHMPMPEMMEIATSTDYGAYGNTCTSP